MREYSIIEKIETNVQEAKPLVSFSFEKFRNLEPFQLNPHSKFNFFFGKNAQGKTSLLEAIYFLSDLKSFKTLENSSMIRHGETNALLMSNLNVHGLGHDLSVLIQRNGKEVHLNGKKPRPFSKLKQLLPIVLFTPDSTRLFRSTPGERRNYFDRFFSILSEKYEFCLEDYQKVYKQKQELIEQIREKGLSEQLLEVWNEKLVILGAQLTKYRFELSSQIALKVRKYFSSLSGFDWQCDLRYEPYLSDLEEGLELPEIQNKIEKEIHRRSAEEIVRNKVLVGPHRDDWLLWMKGQKLKEEGSQGQHRIAVAALKLSEVEILEEMGKVPIALFDDLLSELDSSRCRLMLKILSECACQVFLTSVTPLGISLEGLEGFAFEVNSGKLSPSTL